MSQTHIKLENEQQLPGIIGLLNYDKQTALPLSFLAETLLRRPESTLSVGEREVIASYVSILNGCTFCSSSHGAAAASNLGVDTVEYINNLRNFNIADAHVSPKLRTLLEIAGAVQKGGKNVTNEMVAEAKSKGATDQEIHDTVLIAAAFCMYNRYVDGLGTQCPIEPEAYVEIGKRLATVGYAQSMP